MVKYCYDRCRNERFYLHKKKPKSDIKITYLKGIL